MGNGKKDAQNKKEIQNIGLRNAMKNNGGTDVKESIVRISDNRRTKRAMDWQMRNVRWLSSTQPTRWRSFSPT